MTEIELTESCSIELPHHTIIQDDHSARSEFEQRFGKTMRGWLHRHPLWETAYQYGSEDDYMGLAFERLQQSGYRQRMTFGTPSEALACLCVSLNGVILEALRSHKRPEAVSEPVKGLLHTEIPQQFWQRLQRLLPDVRDQRLLYLLYHCGLQPAEIVRLYPQEWSDLQEVMRLRAIILRRLLAELPLIAAEADQISLR
jgi:hypothetical protein